jgi:hypothetical protein
MAMRLRLAFSTLFELYKDVFAERRVHASFFARTVGGFEYLYVKIQAIIGTIFVHNPGLWQFRAEKFLALLICHVLFRSLLARGHQFTIAFQLGESLDDAVCSWLKRQVNCVKLI